MFLNAPGRLQKTNFAPRQFPSRSGGVRRFYRSNMARIRNIKPALFRSVELYELETSTNEKRKKPYLNIRMAFAGLFTIADVKGRFEWKPRIMKLDCLPHDLIDFEDVLDALRDGGFIQKYKSKGIFYGFIPTFEKHQKFHTREVAAGSKLPSPTEVLPRQCPGNAQAMPSTSPEGLTMDNGQLTTDNGQLTTAIPPKEGLKEKDFETWWEAYPSKVGRLAALKIWKKNVQGKVDLSKMLLILEKQKTSDKWTKENGRFIPNPATYLNQGWWDDEVSGGGPVTGGADIIGSIPGMDLEKKYGGHK